MLVERKVGLLRNKKNGDCEERVHHTGIQKSGSIFEKVAFRASEVTRQPQLRSSSRVLVALGSRLRGFYDELK